MKKIKENFGGILLCLGQLLIGILLLINPAGFTSGIIIAVGAVLLLAGIVSAIRYFRMPPVPAAAQALPAVRAHPGAGIRPADFPGHAASALRLPPLPSASTA